MESNQVGTPSATVGAEGDTAAIKAANNFVRGHRSMGNQYIGHVSDKIHKMAEQSNSLQRFFIFHYLALVFLYF